MVFLAVQAIVPLRHWVYPGDVAWTEEGHRFAWRMKLRSKRAHVARFYVVDYADNHVEVVDPDDELAYWQAGSMKSRPDMLLQYAHHLASRAAMQGRPGVAVYADVVASLNDHAPARLIDPDVNLATVPRTLGRTPWVLPRLSREAGDTRPLTAERWLLADPAVTRARLPRRDAPPQARSMVTAVPSSRSSSMVRRSSERR
jgi:hypothetical protein